MKMKKYAFILWAALAMTSAFTACTDNDSPISEPTETKTVTICATIDGDIGSRVALTDDAENRSVKVDWKQGDAFKINVNDVDYTFTYTTNNKFECSDANFPATFTSAGTVTATYPAITPTEYATQSGTLDGAASLLTMTATIEVEAGQPTENLALTFNHDNSIVKLTLTNEDFKGESVTGVTLASGSSAVATATGSFTGDANNGSIVAYFVVEPQAMADVSIRAVCEGKKYTATLTEKTLEAGKLYNVGKAMAEDTSMGDKTAAQAVKGDLAMADGTFISNANIATLTDEQKGNVRGIVFWTANQETTATTTPAKLTDDEIMKADFPNCTHGLIVSLKNVAGETKWQSTKADIASWQSSGFTDANKNKYESIASGIDATAPINYILGYQNTKLLKAYNEQCADAYKVIPVSLLENFSEQNPAPNNTTGWFIPSVKELTLLCGIDVDDVKGNNSGGTDTKTAMNTILTSLGGSYADTFDTSFYWSSSEYTNNTYAFSVHFYQGAVDTNSYKVYSSGTCVRAVCAY